MIHEINNEFKFKEKKSQKKKACMSEYFNF